jgi:hypothetical protein
MNASRMMARITTTTQKKNTTMPGMAYPATVLALATAASYPPPFDLFSLFGGFTGHEDSGATGLCRRTDRHVADLLYRPRRHGETRLSGSALLKGALANCP